MCVQYYIDMCTVLCRCVQYYVCVCAVLGVCVYSTKWVYITGKHSHLSIIMWELFECTYIEFILGRKAHFISQTSEIGEI